MTADLISLCNRLCNYPDYKAGIEHEKDFPSPAGDDWTLYAVRRLQMGQDRMACFCYGRHVQQQRAKVSR